MKKRQKRAIFMSILSVSLIFTGMVFVPEEVLAMPVVQETESTLPESRTPAVEEQNTEEMSDSEAISDTERMQDQDNLNTYHDLEIELNYPDGIVPYSDAELPEDYSSVSAGYISSVKNQNPYGTCWAFAWLAAGEASIRRKGSSVNYDLSELQLAYASYHTPQTEMKGLEGDSLTVTGDFLNNGGNNLLTTFISASWKGAVDENAYPAAAWSQASTSYVLPEELYSDSNAAVVRSALWLDTEEPVSVKQAVMEYGAAAVGMYYSSANLQGCSYYQNARTGTNHAVTIVGWDDNYSKSNFKTEPPEDGAWLIKNSYGSSWGDGGYFWVSYGDTSISSTTAIAVDMDDSFEDYIYQYDGGVNPFSYCGEKYAANVFTAARAEELKAIAFATDWVGVDYTVEIYRNVQDVPTSGIKVYEQSGSEEYAGYHTVTLDTVVPVTAGEKFAVVVSLSCGSSTAYVLTDTNLTQSWFTSVSSSKAGQSYASDDKSSWSDISAGGSSNCRIKAFTDDQSASVGEIPLKSMTLNKQELTLPVGSSEQLTVTFSPLITTDSLAVTWESSDRSVAEVDAAGKVTMVGHGTAEIHCVGSRLTAVCTVSSQQQDISGAKISAVADQTFTGYAIEPAVTVILDSVGTLTEETDYQVFYSNNVYVGTAKVTITGLGAYTGTLGTEFQIVEAVGQLYKDVPNTPGWRYDAIKYVTEQGIMNGISGTGNFEPDSMLTRAMFATIIYRMEGSPAAWYSAVFPDVPNGNYYSIPVVWANSVGIINGHSNTGLFGTYENITREDLVTIMFRYAKYKGYDTSGRNTLTDFPDAGKVSGYARAAVQWAVARGIIKGRSNTGLLDPQGNATRVECAAIIQRFMQVYGGI